MAVIDIEKRKIEKAAQSVRSWIEDAVGDMANYTDIHMMDKKWRKKIAQAKRDGVVDLQGWLADEYYNDVDMLTDLCGDRIHDEATMICTSFRGDRKRFNEVYLMICEELKGMSHFALKKAVDKLIVNHKGK